MFKLRTLISKMYI